MQHSYMIPLKKLVKHSRCEIAARSLQIEDDHARMSAASLLLPQVHDEITY